MDIRCYDSVVCRDVAPELYLHTIILSQETLDTGEYN